MLVDNTLPAAPVVDCVSVRGDVGKLVFAFELVDVKHAKSGAVQRELVNDVAGADLEQVRARLDNGGGHLCHLDLNRAGHLVKASQRVHDGLTGVRFGQYAVNVNDRVGRRA